MNFWRKQIPPKNRSKKEKEHVQNVLVRVGPLRVETVAGQHVLQLHMKAEEEQSGA